MTIIVTKGAPASTIAEAQFSGPKIDRILHWDTVRITPEIFCILSRTMKHFFAGAPQKALSAFLFLFLIMLISIDNSKLVNNFFYVFLLLPAVFIATKEKIKPTTSALIIGTYLIYISVSTIWGTGDILATAKQLKYVLYILAFTLLIHTLIYSDKQITAIAAGGLITGLLLEAYSFYLQITAIGIDQWLKTFPRLSKVTGPLNPVYLALTIGLFAFILIARKARNPWLSTTLVLILTLVTLPLQSRTLILALAIGHGYLLFTRRDFLPFLLWTALCLAGGITLLFSIDRFTTQFYRGSIWLDAITSYWQDCSWVFGCGHRYNFQIHVGDIYIYHPHSIILSQVLYGGLFGAMLLLTALWAILKELRDRPEHWKAVLLYCFMASLPIGHTLLTHPDFIWVLIWLPLALSGILFRPVTRSAHQRSAQPLEEQAVLGHVKTSTRAELTSRNPV